MAWYDAALVGIFNDIIETDNMYELPKDAGKTAFQFLVTLRQATDTDKPIHVSASIETRAAVAAQDDRSEGSEFSDTCRKVYLDMETMADGEWEDDHWVVNLPTAVCVMSMFIDLPWAETIYQRIWDQRDTSYNIDDYKEQEGDRNDNG
jgi:hypothetical protein